MIAVSGGAVRTGSIAILNLLAELVKETKAGEMVRPKTRENLAKQVEAWAMRDDWVVLKMHGPYEEVFPYKDRVRAVISYRNLLDVAVSIHHFNGAALESVMHTRGFKGNIWNYERWFEHFPEDQILTVRYETELVTNRVDTTLRIANLLGIPLTEEQARRVERRCNITASKKKMKSKKRPGQDGYMAKRHIYSNGKSKWREELPDEIVEKILDMEGVRAWQRKMGYYAGEE